MSNPRSPESHSPEFPKLTSAAKADAAGVGRFSIATLASGGEAAHSSQCQCTPPQCQCWPPQCTHDAGQEKQNDISMHVALALGEKYYDN